MAEGQPTTHETTAEVSIDLTRDIERLATLGALGPLLADHSTNGNIAWATNVFAELGVGYQPTDEIIIPAITGDNISIVRTRAQKAQGEQSELTRKHAEVFTPSWVCKKMIDFADDAWHELNAEATWKDYVASPRLEITCGEAPYLANRYDAANGASVMLDERCGILDRKLRLIGKHVRSRKSWMRWALVALRSTYGYEFQGDNLLIARINVLCTLEDFAEAKGFLPFSEKEYADLVRVISWNIWQMDGLSDCVPLGAIGDTSSEMRLPGFDELFGFSDQEQLSIGITSGRGLARIYDWENGNEIEFKALKREGTEMRFDYVIGNPPYQEETDGNGRQQPIYDKFMDAAYEVGDIVELITPARFLFNAGQTTKTWNQKMLSDRHLKVIYYETDATKVFSGTDIKGGVAITLRNASVECGSIGIFTAYPELNEIIQRVNSFESGNARLDSIFASQRLYKFSETFFEEFSDDPNAQFFLGTGTRNKILSSAMEKMPEVFVDKSKPDKDDIRFLGRIAGRRQWRYVARRFIRDNEYLDAFKLFIPEANNSGKFGETLTEPIVGHPGEGSADTFLNAGPFETEEQPSNLARYYKTKFFRALLGARKVTQHSPSPVWQTIPLQDFTSASDIDWSQPIAAIDQQLYAKYDLSQDNIDFIETHVKEMQ